MTISIPLNHVRVHPGAKMEIRAFGGNPSLKDAIGDIEGMLIECEHQYSFIGFAKSLTLGSGVILYWQRHPHGLASFSARNINTFEFRLLSVVLHTSATEQQDFEGAAALGMPRLLSIGWIKETTNEQ